MKKKLIEVALPLEAINAACMRETSIRVSHPKTLHAWWARRPLAACRAVLFAQLVDDPSAHPKQYPSEAEQDAERHRLFGLIRRLIDLDANGDNSAMDNARREIAESCNDKLPPILDPFAGGGSIPLEAQRLGLTAIASDLNPVAVLINRALIEIPAKIADQPPVHPLAEARTRWHGLAGIIEDLRLYGQWMKTEAEHRIGHLFPLVTLSDGSQATAISWIWARTVQCPNPACSSEIPMASSYWLRQKRGQETWVQPVIQPANVAFEVAQGAQGPIDPPKSGRGAKFNCLLCGSSTSDKYVRSEGVSGRIGRMLMAIAVEGNRRRVYITPTKSQPNEVEPSEPELGTISPNSRYMIPPYYGYRSWDSLFTARQFRALCTFSDLISEVREMAVTDAQLKSLDENSAEYYGDAIATYLAFVVNKLADRNNSFVPWAANVECQLGLFARQSISMLWDYAEGNPFSSSSGSWSTILRSFLRSMSSDHFDFLRHAPGAAFQHDARTVSESAVIATDPPYYDNVGYADLSDFFYVWLRRSLRSVYPDLFSTISTPKAAELTAFAHRHEGSQRVAAEHFEGGFVEVFSNARSVALTDYPMTFFYAFKQTEDSSDGLASTGWSTMLEGLLAARWMVTATWPVRTERSTRARASKSNALATSVVLACRPRPDDADVTDRQGLLRALRDELPGPIREMQKSAIAPVDLRQAAIGPGMAVFSRYARVVESDGMPMRVHTALGLINQVLEAVLGEAEADLDPETRWAIAWYTQHFEDEGPYGVAEQLAVSMNVAIEALSRLGIVESGGGKVRILSRDELSTWIPPAGTSRAPVWTATQQLVRQLEDGEAAASILLAQLGSQGEACRALAYRLYTICETSRPNLAGPYNALAASWPEIHRHATQAPPPLPATEPRLFSP